MVSGQAVAWLPQKKFLPLSTQPFEMHSTKESSSGGGTADHVVISFNGDSKFYVAEFGCNFGQINFRSVAWSVGHRRHPCRRVSLSGPCVVKLEIANCS